MTFTVEYEQESDGRWLAEVLEPPGVLRLWSNVRSGNRKISGPSASRLGRSP
jgi:hypothetical protein